MVHISNKWKIRIMFKKLGLAITFSPTGKALLAETRRLKLLFNSELYLIHVGERNSETEERLRKLVLESNLKPEEINFIWGSGNPADVIIDSIKKNSIDLLIAGALEKEKTIKYYFGSVARKLMRKVPCSLLILTSAMNSDKEFKKLGVLVDFSPENENTIQKANQFAMMEKSDQLILIREIDTTGISASAVTGNSANEMDNYIEKIINEESIKLSILVNELNLRGVDISKICLPGKEGWAVRQFLRKEGIDLFIVSAPARRLGFFDRVFQHDLEYIFVDIPCDLLIIKNSSK